MGLGKGRGCSGFRHARASKDEAARFLPRSMGGGGLRRQRYGRGHAYRRLAVMPNCSSSDCVHDEESSSSEDGTGVVRRKSHLDDALFDFFSKEAIKSLKRDFSKFCRDSDMWAENKRPKFSGVDKKCFSVYSFKYFFEVLNRLTVEQSAIIEKFGFGCLLCLSKTYIPSSFIRWLAWSVDVDCSQIIVDDKIIYLSKDSFHLVLGLPNAGDELVENSDAGMDFIKSLFHLSEVPHITFFGNKLNSKQTLSDQEVFVCFMQVAICCFLCPSASDHLDTKYIDQLGNPERSRSFDVCQLVYKHLMLGITKMSKFAQLKGRNPKVFEFCSYALAVYYLDSLDFGIHIAGTGFPRAASWRGDMIKVYSDLDRKSRRCFGKRRMKKNLAECYLGAVNVMNQGFDATNCEFMSKRQKASIHDKFGMTLSGQTIDGILDIVQSLDPFCLDTSNKREILVHDILHFLANAHPWYKSSGVMKSDMGILDTPCGVAKKPVEKNSTVSAPGHNPVAKVKSRLTINLPEGCIPLLSQDDLVSPIGRMNLSPCSVAKETSKVAGKFEMANLCQKKSLGSKETPIPVGDTTPKAFPEAGQVVQKPATKKLSSKILNGNEQTTIHIGDTTPKVELVGKAHEVKITGVSTFKDRQNLLSQNVEEVYNNNMHRSIKHASYSRQNAARNCEAPDVADSLVDGDHNLDMNAHNTGRRSANDKFICLQPKNSLIFPLPENSRFPVSDEDIMHYCAIVDLAYTNRIQKNYALVYHGVHCSFVSLGQTLMPDGHIDNFLIPCFCRKLFEDKHPTKSGRHYFFSYVGESILDFSSSLNENIVRTSFLGAASASKGKRLDLSDRLFFPICHLEHWFTFVVDFKWKLFAFLDSFYGPKSEYQLAVQEPLMKNFAILWKKIFETDEPDFKKFQVMFPNMPRQGNAHNCGVMTMKAMELFDPTKDLRKLFSDNDVCHIRIQYANSLFFHKGNKVDQNVVTSFFDKEDFMRQLHPS